MNPRKLIAATVFALCLSALNPAIGADVDVDRLPEVRTQNGVTYLYGGVGQDEAQAVESAAKEYSLMLTFARQQTGAYLADVSVKIEDKDGNTVLDTVTDGPMLLVKLQAGQYKISAISAARQVTKTVQISADHTTKDTLYWPAEVAE